jgi:hypothetical protein
VPAVPHSPIRQASHLNSNSSPTGRTYVPNRAVTLAPATPVGRPVQTVQPTGTQPQPAPVGLQASAPIQAIHAEEVAKTTSPAALTVEYRNGEVTVVAEKAELGKVLELLGKKIGTAIEVAPEVAKDPVVAHLGPVAPTQALAQLLDGPTLEYIVMGSDESGHVLQRVVVRRRNSFAREPLVAVKAGVATAPRGNASGR